VEAKGYCGGYCTDRKAGKESRNARAKGGDIGRAKEKDKSKACRGKPQKTTADQKNNRLKSVCMQHIKSPLFFPAMQSKS